MNPSGISSAILRKNNEQRFKQLFGRLWQIEIVLHGESYRGVGVRSTRRAVAAVARENRELLDTPPERRPPVRQHCPILRRNRRVGDRRSASRSEERRVGKGGRPG